MSLMMDNARRILNAREEGIVEGMLSAIQFQQGWNTDKQLTEDEILFLKSEMIKIMDCFGYKQGSIDIDYWLGYHFGK
jgi:hypothetical protein